MEDTGSVPGSGRSSGEGNGYLLQHSCLESSMDRGSWWATVHGVAKSWTRLSDQHFHFLLSSCSGSQHWRERREKYLCLISPEDKATGPSSVATGQQVYDQLETCLSLEGDPWLPCQLLSAPLPILLAINHWTRNGILWMKKSRSWKQPRKAMGGVQPQSHVPGPERRTKQISSVATVRKVFINIT